LFTKLFSRQSEQSDLTEEQTIIQQAISAYQSEALPKGLGDFIDDLSLYEEKGALVADIMLPFPCQSELQVLANQVTQAINKPFVFRMTLTVNAVRAHNVANVKNIVAISSGKGGVGKSTTTVNLAKALQAEGAKVGILDADIYGPSIPTMLDLAGQRPTSEDGKRMKPLFQGELAAMSIGFLVDDAQAMVWRGPMASGAFSQLLNDTDWPELDYLLIDMPPGTGDIQLTLAQKVPVAGSVIVTTPQDIALADAQKGIAMFEKVKVPVLGVIENMSYHLCENCGHKSHLFGQDGGKDIAELNHAPLLGQLPLDIQIREEADLGQSSIFTEQDSDLSSQYRKIARNMASKLYYQLDMTSSDTPEIVRS